MKANKIEKKRPKGLIITVVALVALAIAALGVTLAFAKLRALWREPCVVDDVATLVTCSDGTMVKSATLLEMFGVRKGVNLAEIDFEAKRQEILRNNPKIRSLSVTRLMPNRLDIRMEERQPVVRLATGVKDARHRNGKTAYTGYVADAEGVVFKCPYGTRLLPTLRERGDAVTPNGQRLAGRSRAALELITTAADAEFASLTLLEADVSNDNFILATLGNYDQVKIIWEGMDDPSPASHARLVRRLENLLEAIRSNVASGTTLWNATIENRTFADDSRSTQP